MTSIHPKPEADSVYAENGFSGLGTLLGVRRVPRARLSEFVNCPVRFIGCIKSVDHTAGRLALHPGDDNPDPVTVHLKSGHAEVDDPEFPKVNHYVEVFATVRPNFTLQQTGPIVELGATLDMHLVNEAIRLTFHPQLKQYFEPLREEDLKS